jgi:hypothetical protein
VSTQWANIGEDAGALHALISQIPAQLPVEFIDYLWIFPARRVATGESTVVVVGAFDEDAARRRVLTARFTVARDRRGAATVTPRFDEHGSAPAAAVPRIVQGVLRRLGEDTEAEPREEQIGGSSERWSGLIVELGGRPATDDEASDPGAPSDGGPAEDGDVGAPDSTGAVQPGAGTAAAHPVDSGSGGEPS